MKPLLSIALCLCSTSCLASYGVHVQPGAGDANAIEAEIRYAIEQWCQWHEVDHDRWTLGMRVDVRRDVWLEVNRHDKVVPVDGTYDPMPFDDIQIVWHDGVCENALFHELLHRYLKKQDHPDWHMHTPIFLLSVVDDKEDYGCH